MSSPHFLATLQSALQTLATGDLHASTTALLATLGYASPKTLDLPTQPQAFAGELETLLGGGKQLSALHASLADWKSAAFLFQLTNDELPSLAAGQASLLDGGSVQAWQVESFVFLALDLKPGAWSRTRLAALTAGLYVGEAGRHSSMGADHLIDKREAIRADPPDILLTNYKMLDFLLLRNDDKELWAGNNPDTLQYVVLDEFHTYDGAQGTDVAMLLRRLYAQTADALEGGLESVNRETREADAKRRLRERLAAQLAGRLETVGDVRVEIDLGHEGAGVR